MVMLGLIKNMNVGEIKMKVPANVKLHVDRIIREYEVLLHKKQTISIQISDGNQLYSGLGTTKYYLEKAKHFRNLLYTTNRENVFSGTEGEFRRKIYNKICEFYKPLSKSAILRITRTIECQDQLEKALIAAKRNSSTVEDAKQLLCFILDGYMYSWCKKDVEINHKVFKLIKSEEAFEKLLKSSDRNPITEITQESKSPYTSFRVALQIFSIEDCYRKQAKMREFHNFWERCRNIDEFDMDYKIFNMWNNITETGIYYVYIPKN